MAFQITRLTIVYSTVYSGADQRKHQGSASVAFVRVIHWWPVNSLHKWPVTRKMFPFDDVIICITQKTFCDSWSASGILQTCKGWITHGPEFRRCCPCWPDYGLFWSIMVYLHICQSYGNREWLKTKPNAYIFIWYRNVIEMIIDLFGLHYNDVIMGSMVSQITSLAIVDSTVYSGADQRKHQSSASLAFVRENSPVTGEFPAQMASDAENVSIWWRHHVMGALQKALPGNINFVSLQ